MQSESRTTFRRGTTPRVNCDVRGFGRVALGWRAVKRIRREEPFHAFHVPGGRPITHVHVTATNPLRARRHPDLITSSVIADGRAGRVATVEEIVAREWRIISARVSAAVMDGVVPVIIMVGVYSVPAAIVRL